MVFFSSRCSVVLQYLVCCCATSLSLLIVVVVSALAFATLVASANNVAFPTLAGRVGLLTR